MSNLTLSMALARSAKPAAKDLAPLDSPMTDAPETPTITAVDDLQRPALKEGDDAAAVPVLIHTIPAIFAPLRQDLLAPIEPAKDRVERMQQMQDRLTANETAVRDNFAWMFEREARRRVADAKKTHDFSQPHQPEIIGWQEADQLIASMSTAAVPGQSYHVGPEKLAEWHERIAGLPAGSQPPHEETTRSVLVVANNGSLDIEDYSVKHIKPIREKVNASLHRADGL